VLVNAIVGALRGILDESRDWDLVGVTAFALLMGLGGGFIRDLLIGNLPAESLRSPWFLATVFVGIAIARVGGRVVTRSIGCSPCSTRSRSACSRSSARRTRPRSGCRSSPPC
jgi:uncharacterized membrane protein YeiH